MMYAGVGMALGGVGDHGRGAANLIIAKAGWLAFRRLLYGCRLSPSRYWYVGLLTCMLVEKMRWFWLWRNVARKSPGVTSFG